MRMVAIGATAASRPPGWTWTMNESDKITICPTREALSERVTLTLPVINSARHVVFVAAATGKTAVVSRVFGPDSGKPPLPA